MPIHVLHATETVMPEAGSVGVSLPGMSEELRKHGIESQTLSAGADGAFDRAAAGALVEKHEVVHIHGWGSDLARGVAKLAHKAGTPYVLSPHGAFSDSVYNPKTWKDKLRGKLGENRLIERAAVVAAVNEDEERNLRGQQVHSNVHLLPYGLPFAEYKDGGAKTAKLPAPLKGRCLLMLGPVHPVEGFVPLLRGLAELGKEADDWHIVIAGREAGEYRKMLEAAARRKAALDRVMFAPAPDVPTQRAWLGRASLLAATSLHVRCPISLLQAVAVGVPVIATHHVAPAVLDGSIRICGPSRPEIKEALRSMLMLSDAERSAMGQKAQDVGEKLLDWSALLERYVQLYRGLT